MSDERRLLSERVTEQPVRPRRAIAYFWWQHERDAHLRTADVLVARRAENALHDDEAARQLPAAG